MDKLFVAFATDDNINLSKNHFGEAKNYQIFEIYEFESKLINNIPNESPEEKMHGDPNKAKGVSKLLKPYNVKVLVGGAFGRNIVRQQKQFVVIIGQESNINKQITAIQKNFKNIIELWKQGENRNYIKL